jgi:hypothetical protein
MNNDLFSAISRFELMAFFSGYPLIYTLTLVIAGNDLLKEKFIGRTIPLLPLAYALVGTLFLGFQFKKLFPDYSFEHIRLTIKQPGLVAWGLLSILFWIPTFNRKTILSLLHSLVFFVLLATDLFMLLSSQSADNNMVRNDMEVYVNSLLLNVGAFAVLITLCYFFPSFKKK